MNTEKLKTDPAHTGPMLLEAGRIEPTGATVDVYGWSESLDTPVGVPIERPRALIVHKEGSLKLHGQDRRAGAGDIFILPVPKPPPAVPKFDIWVWVASLVILATATRFFLLLG